MRSKKYPYSILWRFSDPLFVFKGRTAETCMSPIYMVTLWTASPLMSSRKPKSLDMFPVERSPFLIQS